MSRPDESIINKWYGGLFGTGHHGSLGRRYGGGSIFFGGWGGVGEGGAKTIRETPSA